MRKTVLMVIVLAAFGLVPVQAALQSERGDHALDAPSEKAEPKKWQADREPIPRDYVQQPPLIPHKTDGYVINLKSNKCLTCHSWANYKQARATKVSLTHFADREGDAMSNISPRRYFCTQCHVPQTDAKPLVDNSFKPVQTIKK
jgi:nitrate reductase (cytochrome), electron transfer subunit